MRLSVFLLPFFFFAFQPPFSFVFHFSFEVYREAKEGGKKKRERHQTVLSQKERQIMEKNIRKTTTVIKKRNSCRCVQNSLTLLSFF